MTTVHPRLVLDAGHWVEIWAAGTSPRYPPIFCTGDPADVAFERQQATRSRHLWRCEYCGRWNEPTMLQCDGCNAGRGRGE